MSRADGFMSVAVDGAAWSVELFSEEGKAVCKRQVKAPVQSEDALQVQTAPPLPQTQ